MSLRSRCLQFLVNALGNRDLNQEQLQQQYAMQALMELLSEAEGDQQQLVRFGLTIALEALDMSEAVVYQMRGGQPEIQVLVGPEEASVALSRMIEIIDLKLRQALPSHEAGKQITVITDDMLNDGEEQLLAQTVLAVGFQNNTIQCGGVVFTAPEKQPISTESKGFATFVMHWLQQHTLQTALYDALGAAKDEVAQLAFYDSLTQLPNKRLLMDRLKQSLLQSQRDRCYGALLFIDLDDFKNLNETLGHEAGDLLLQTAAHRLENCLREMDTVARMGGDEFVVMLDQLETEADAATVHIETVGDKIIEALNQPYQLNGQDYFNSPTLGATLYNGLTDQADEVLKRADIAMYQAKNAGKNCLRFFDQHIQANLMHKARLEEDLRIATKEKQFELYYQPQVDYTGRVTGAEALIRWTHPVRGVVSPMEFIPIAEKTGQIIEIGHWVLETACEQLATWANDPSMAHLHLAVNVSARQFQQPDFVLQVLQACRNAGINPSLLKLELTESMLVNDVDDVITKMSQLGDQGVSFALDDFGTGFSSLSYLKQLPLNQLKIDKSFVRDVLSDNNDAVIARTIVALANSLGLNVIAEGVEHEGQRKFLTLNGCYEYQGYLFSKPLTIANFNAYFKQANKSQQPVVDVRIDKFGLN